MGIGENGVIDLPSFLCTHNLEIGNKYVNIECLETSFINEWKTIFSAYILEVCCLQFLTAGGISGQRYMQYNFNCRVWTKSKWV